MKTRLLIALFLLGALRAFAAEAAPPPMTKLPLTGFKPLFNGKDMKGWHWSRTVRHGTVGGFRIEGGAMTLFQNPYGQGGLLMTDKRYKNFEFYVETDIQPGYNSGIFVRSSESGYAYQIELTGGQSTTDLMVESLKPLSAAGRTTRFAELWNPNGWNSVRIRMEGDDPQITCWLNDTELWSVKVNNSQIAGETDGFIGLQLHWTFPTGLAGSTMALSSWKPDGVLRFRNIFVKEL